MTNRRKALWAVAAVITLLVVAAISMPNFLLRSRTAAKRGSVTTSLEAEQQVAGVDGGGATFRFSPEFAAPANPAAPDKKLVHNAQLELVVRDVRAAAEQIRKLVDLNHGEINKLEIRNTTGGPVAATLAVRVPASGLENALAEFKKVAVRTEREQVSTRDVSGEFYDNEAHMRNLRAEEQQYLVIMKQAHTVKDTLEVSEKLSDVRDRIERLQSQIQLMTHDIEMSLVTIALTQESEARAFDVGWHPLYNAKAAVRDLLEGLGDWVDSVVAILIELPLIILWTLTVGAILWVVWQIGRSVWLRFLKPRLAPKAQ
jgi:hypothetical protein